MKYAVGRLLSQHVAPVSPHSLSRQIRIENVSAFSCVVKLQPKATMGVVLSLLFIQQFNSMWSINSTTFDTSSTPTSVNSMSRIVMFRFLSTCGVLGIHSCPGNLSFQGLFIFIVRHLDIFTWYFNWLNVITIWGQIRVQSVLWTCERTALPYFFHAAGNC